MSSDEIKLLEQKLYGVLKEKLTEGIALAYSGGVDSSFLLEILTEINAETPGKAIALTMCSPLQEPEFQMKIENKLKNSGIPWKSFHLNPLELEQVKNNRKKRCYFCKKMMFLAFQTFAEENGFHTLMDGSNTDDKKEFRPGGEACRELNIFSPLAELGFGKDAIRQCLRFRHSSVAELPSKPCFATRFEYDVELTEAMLNTVCHCENFVQKYLPPNANLRLRVHGSTARIEAEAFYWHKLLENRESILRELHRHGFQHVCLDLDGFRSGSFDHDLSRQKQNE